MPGRTSSRPARLAPESATWPRRWRCWPSSVGCKVLYRKAHQLIDDIGEARKLCTLGKYRSLLKATELLVIKALFLRCRPATAGDEVADVLSRCENQSTIITSNPPLEYWAQLLGDVVVILLPDRLMHLGSLLKFEAGTGD